jgi:hypothetical protein
MVLLGHCQAWGGFYRVRLDKGRPREHSGIAAGNAGKLQWKGSGGLT